ncbi:MAG: peptidase M55 [Bacillati bacterium ANGP1]|uniref:Peptidase M55 n=1 Tax=Candidatus Segetimicrobium genomatis TaxID=2569760 RepID=A0A537L3A1_9BACT|nr:MAG: peptidase M55 [Terrabacteria group bacterium ANGP1]
MKIYISVDMEGIAGVAVAKHVQPDQKEYERFRRLMTQEANAAVEGALAGGAREVVVSDGHGPMTNILIEDLHRDARLLSGSNRLLCQMEGIDQSFAAVFFVGYHQREGGGDGILNHTLLGRIVQEIEAERRLQGVLVAPVKEGFDRYAGLSITPEKAQAMIREQAREAMDTVRAKRVTPYKVAAPVTFEVEFKRTAPARMATLFPGVERRGPRTIAVTDSDYVRAFKLTWGCLIVGMASFEGLL